MMVNETVETDCCDNVDNYLIGDGFGNGRVRVEGTCPVCGAEDPLGTLIESDNGLERKMMTTIYPARW
jgi:hypothetical protein